MSSGVLKNTGTSGYSDNVCICPGTFNLINNYKKPQFC